MNERDGEYKYISGYIHESCFFCRFLENISNDAGVDDDNDVDAGTNDGGVVKTESDYVGTMSFGYNVVAAEKSGDVEWMLLMNFLYSDLHKSPPFLLQVL